MSGIWTRTNIKVKDEGPHGEGERGGPFGDRYTV